MNFATTAKNNSNIKLTENGAMAYSTTNNALVDLFAQIGALRPRTEAEIAAKFAEAMKIDPLMATKMVFYAGNVRGGLGERRTFRVCLNYLAKNYPSIVRANIHLIAHFNRWDSLFTLVDTPVEKCAWDVIREQLMLDMNDYLKSKDTSKKIGISLLAKWMPTETAHSVESQKLAKKAARELGLTPRDYRKMLSALRKHIGVVETLMSANQWDSIEYPSVPSYAMKNYRDAFEKHDEVRFAEYKESLNKDEAKINASTLFPYDLVHQYMGQRRMWGMGYAPDGIIEAQWKALPNYIEGENNILVMADVSGSMMGRPMETSIGLATYFAQHNRGDYHGLYMSFTSDPHFINIEGCKTLASAVREVETAGVGYSTNLDRAFDMILRHAVDYNVSDDELPEALVVISDMEIDPYFRNDHCTDFLGAQRKKFAKFGYTLPKLVLWNVEVRNDTFLTKSNDVVYVSGQSASVFRQLCGNLNGVTAYDLMVKALSDPMYDCVVI